MKITITQLLEANRYLEEVLNINLPFDIVLELSRIKEKISGEVSAFEKAREKEYKRIESKYKKATELAKGEKTRELINTINRELESSIQAVIRDYKELEIDDSGLTKIPIWKFDRRQNEDIGANSNESITGNHLYYLRFFIDSDKIKKTDNSGEGNVDIEKQ